MAIPLFLSRALSNPVEFTIVEPESIDADALAAVDAVCHRWDLAGPVAEAVLAEYPASIYHGWALIDGDKPIRVDRHLTAESVRLAHRAPATEAARRRIAEGHAARLERARTQIDALARFLVRRPEFWMADWMVYEIAYWRAYREEFAEADTILEWLLDKHGLPEFVRTRAEGLAVYVRERAR